MSSLLDGFNKSLQFDWDDMLNRPNGGVTMRREPKAYRRADSSTVKVSRLELGRLVLEGSHQSFEELPASTPALKN